MAHNIAAKTNLAHPLILHNRTQSRTESFAASLPNPERVKVASSIEDAVKPADIVFTSLPDDASVWQIYKSIVEACGGSLKGNLLAESSTILPERTEEIAKFVGGGGGEFIPAPVPTTGPSLCPPMANKMYSSPHPPRPMRAPWSW